MAGFTGFPFPNSSSSSSSSSAPSFGFATAPSSSSTPYSAFTAAPSSSSSPYFGFATPSAPASQFGAPPTRATTPSSSPPTQNIHDEAMIKSIIEAVENLEKTEGFPPEILQQMKQELEKKYPNIFSTRNNNAQASEGYTNYNNNNSFASVNSIANSQQEFFNNYNNAFNQHMNSNFHQIHIQTQALIQAQTQMMQQNHMNISPNYYGNYSSYPGNGDAAGSANTMNMILGMMGNNNNGLTSNVFGGTAFGTGGSSTSTALSKACVQMTWQSSFHLPNRSDTWQRGITCHGVFLVVSLAVLAYDLLGNVIGIWQ